MAKSKAKNFIGKNVQLFSARQGQYDHTPETVILEKRIDRGGSSHIHPFANAHGYQPERIAKIYTLPARSPSRALLNQKCDVLVRNFEQLSAALPFVIWPDTLIADPAATGDVLDRFLGISMPRLPADTVSLETIFNAESHQFFIGTNGAMRLAAEIAQCLHRLHQHLQPTFVFGDFNPKNIRVSEDYQKVTFIDADGFQIHVPFTGQKLACEGLYPGYGSPEGIKAIKTKQDRVRTIQDDEFILAILIFRLLVKGGHPFTTGISYVAPDGGPTDDDSNIVARRYAMSNPGLYAPPGETHEHFKAINQDIKDAFQRVFVHGLTVSSLDWGNLLSQPGQYQASQHTQLPRFASRIAQQPITPTTAANTEFTPLPRPRAPATVPQSIPTSSSPPGFVPLPRSKKPTMRRFPPIKIVLLLTLGAVAGVYQMTSSQSDNHSKGPGIFRKSTTRIVALGPERWPLHKIDYFVWAEGLQAGSPTIDFAAPLGDSKSITNPNTASQAIGNLKLMLGFKMEPSPKVIERRIKPKTFVETTPLWRDCIVSSTCEENRRCILVHHPFHDRPDNWPAYCRPLLPDLTPDMIIESKQTYDNCEQRQEIECKSACVWSVSSKPPCKLDPALPASYRRPSIPKPHNYSNQG